MTYTLCKQLKKAGFPQDTEYHYRNVGGNWEIWKLSDLSVEECYASPTLEELIDACGEKVNGIFLHTFKGKCSAWVQGRSPKTGGKAKTPTEAVAKLYIKLSKKL